MCFLAGLYSRVKAKLLWDISPLGCDLACLDLAVCELILMIDKAIFCCWRGDLFSQDFNLVKILREMLLS